MKYGDVQKLHEAGLTTDEQRQNITAHFQLKEDGGQLTAQVVGPASGRGRIKEVFVDGKPFAQR